MKPNFMKSQSGFSLAEILVAMGIFGLVLVGAAGAFKYFTSQTTKEFSKMESISEFNQLTRDLLKFSEGAGISTSYLNYPVKVKDCEYDVAISAPKEPCVMKIVDGKMIVPAEEEIPKQLRECTQFFKDGRGGLVPRRAYPGKPRTDLVNVVDDQQIKPPASLELVTVWPIIDEKSAPFLMMKMKDAAPYFSMLKGAPSEISKHTNMASAGPKVEYAFFESPVSDPDTNTMSANIDQIMKLVNVPFLIYNTYLTNHYTIQYAAEIISCQRDQQKCLEILLKTAQKPSGTADFQRTIANPAYPATAGSTPTIDQTSFQALSQDLDSQYPTNVFAIKFKPIDMKTPFFAEILQRQKLPTSCMSSWDINKQSPEDYFFPSKAYSVFGNGGAADDIAGTDPLNVLHLSHYYTGVSMSGMSSATAKGLMLAVPIDILTYRAVLAPGSTEIKKKVQLVARRWYAIENTNIKDAVRIEDLKNPFMITRRIGTSEMGLWYNPIESKQVVPIGDQQ